MEEEGLEGPDEGYLLIRIHVPELNVQKCLQFPRDQLVWDVKQQCLAALPKELKESFNYGLFSPPENGRAGKFLDEERRLTDYPFNGPVGYLELKYKRRVYKTLSLDEKQIKSLHTRANLRRFLDYVHNGQVEKISKMCSKGLDPNFHCAESGETPLSIATSIKRPGKAIMALVNGGALLDYRTKDGSTAMHRAVEHKSLEAMKTLLELGASPNYKDGKGLTPLYLTITHNADHQFTETLLHDHAITGAQDLQGQQEVHQACKAGMLQHLEHLLFYGADMNARNNSGNTPLHVCAVNGQESCARQLLFRGADMQALNKANQTPYQVAVIASNMELADIIQNYRQEDVVPYRGPPSYNPKRRSALGWLTRAPSMSTLMALPPSPCPSDRSSAPFSSASSSLSDGSNVPMGHETDTASIVTVLALGVADKSLGDTSDIISDSSGVGTANSDTTNCSLSTGTTVVCIESYKALVEGHLSMTEGDIIEVTGTSDDGFLEGTIRSAGNRCGLFPPHCVQEVRFRHPQNIQMVVARDTPPRQPPPSHPSSGRVVGRRESTNKHFATAPRQKKTYDGDSEPRTVVLHRGRKGFGFILRGAKATSPPKELVPSEKCPALQYLDDVDPGGVADRAGLKKGDFLLRINDEDVSAASHEHVVDLIRNSGNLVKMTVMSLGFVGAVGSMPMSKSTILPKQSDTVPSSRQCATLPRKLGTYSTLGRAQAPLPPRRDPKTTLSVGRARAKSMVAGLEGGDKEETEDMTKSSSAESVCQPAQPRTASIRQRPTSSRITSAELEEIFQRRKAETAKTNMRLQESTPSPTKTRVYASVAEMKRSKSKAATTNKVRFSSILQPPVTPNGGGEMLLRRDFHSTPDLVQECLLNRNKYHRSQEDLTRLLPPPTHPPPPPPPPSSGVQVVALEMSRGKSDAERKEAANGVVSSFRPTASAKLYASPEDMKSVGYRSKSVPSANNGRTLRKSHSMKTSSTFRPPHTSTPPGSNPYAQPIRTSRSHSSAGNNNNVKERRRKSASSVAFAGQGGAPPIPEPDYSCSESDRESDKDGGASLASLASRLATVQLQPVENSGNSNTSGSSSGSSSVPHSFSVEEIQRGKSLLKSSKSYPEDFLKKQNESELVALEDGDNSSSGVSSDQENAIGGNSEYTERLTHEHNSMTLPSPKTQHKHHTSGLLSRHAVSLAQLPPPIEADSDEKEEFCLPPPPEFGGGGNPPADGHQTEAVLAPPPQFSDNRQVSRVRIVGALPKNSPPPLPSSAPVKVKQGRLHSQ